MIRNVKIENVKIEGSRFAFNLTLKSRFLIKKQNPPLTQIKDGKKLL